MMFLILYDISNDRIRTKVAKRLISEGYERIQLSVFAGPLNPRENIKLWQQLESYLAPEVAARFFVIRIGANQFKNMFSIGDIDFDILYLLGEKNCIFI